MRITETLMSSRTRNYIQQSMQKLARTQEMVSTTKKILRLSDDPSALSQLLNARNSIASNEQYMQNINDGISYLDAADTALGTAGEIVQKAKEYALQGATGSVSEEDREAIAEQIDKMVDQMLDIANTTVGGKYIFAGTDNNRPPFSRNGDVISYEGNLQRVSREILDQASYPIDVPGVTDSSNPPGVFGTLDPSDNSVDNGAFQTLIDLRNALKNDDADALQNSIGKLDTQLDSLLQQRVQVGARFNHFEAVKSQLKNQEVTMNQVISNLEDADIAQVSVGLASQQLAYQASLAAGAQILQTSLLQFLR